MSFMISRETENIQSLSEVEGAFRAITANGDKPYVTKDEIFQVADKQNDTCMSLASRKFTELYSDINLYNFCRVFQRSRQSTVFGG